MRCESCKVDYESDANYCRKCGKLLDTSSQRSAEEVSAEHNIPTEVVKPTSIMDVDFSNPPSPRQVEPLRQAGNGKATKNRRRRFRLRGATAVVVQLAIAVTTITYVHRYTLQPQAPTSIAGVAALFAVEQALKELKKELADNTRTNEELSEKIADQRTEIAGQQRELEKLKKTLASAKAELNEVRVEIASSESRRDQLNVEIARIKSELGASRRTLAKLAPKIQEVAKIERRLKVLKTMVSERELVVRNLKRKIESMTNANHASRSRRTPQKG